MVLDPVCEVQLNNRIVIPRPLREQYGIEPGTRILIVPQKDGILLQPIQGVDLSVEAKK